MGERLCWEEDGRDWPLREFSRFEQAGGLRWHVQRLGRGPVALLLHGTGASTHSWRHLAPLLARDFTLLAPDLPGHGFTGMPSSDRLSLQGMAQSIAALLQTMRVRPEFVLGHSAGAAIGLQLCLNGAIRPEQIASLNGALLPWSGLAGHVFPPLAKLLHASPWVPQLFSWRAGDRGVVRRLIAGTGSQIDAQGEAFYQRLMTDPGHARAALAMMAHWDLAPLAHALPALPVPLHLLVGTRDLAVPPAQAQRVAALLPQAHVSTLDGLGHLAHEEDAPRVAHALLARWERARQQA